MSVQTFSFQGRTYAQRAREARLKPTDLGSIIHDCLEKFVRYIMAHGAESADESVMRRIFDGVTDGDQVQSRAKETGCRGTI